MSDEHKTPTNPTGLVQQCDRREVHLPHEYQESFGSYFNAWCPGISRMPTLQKSWIDAAEAFVKLYEEIDGVSDEMSSRDFRLTQEYYEQYKEVRKLLGRPLP